MLNINLFFSEDEDQGNPRGLIFINFNNINTQLLTQLLGMDLTQFLFNPQLLT